MQSNRYHDLSRSDMFKLTQKDEKYRSFKRVPQAALGHTQLQYPLNCRAASRQHLSSILLSLKMSAVHLRQLQVQDSSQDLHWRKGRNLNVLLVPKLLSSQDLPVKWPRHHLELEPSDMLHVWSSAFCTLSAKGTHTCPSLRLNSALLSYHTHFFASLR